MLRDREREREREREKARETNIPKKSTCDSKSHSAFAVLSPAISNKRTTLKTRGSQLVAKSLAHAPCANLSAALLLRTRFVKNAQTSKKWSNIQAFPMQVGVAL